MDFSAPTWQLFENLVRRILEANNYRLEVHSPRGDRGFDFFGWQENEIWAIEVKYYRTARAQPTLIEAAANRLVNNGVASGAAKAMLVVSCIISPELRQTFESRFNVVFVDRLNLRSLAASSPSLIEELDSLVEADPAEVKGSSAEGLNDRQKSKRISSPTPAQKALGAELCKELKNIPRGKDGWPAFEDACARILRYLFPNDLHGWHKQLRTDDGLNRFDFICRVRPTTEFWKFLIDHLNSRYVLFEFKNYNDKIKQGQVLTTEKYLLEKGLRRAGIIITRVGADTDAIKMTQGAMREHGKLMLVLDDKKICEMLHMKDGGDDPSDRLFEVADEFLLTLPR